MNRVYHKQFRAYKKQLDAFIDNFNVSGEQYGDVERNQIKLFGLNGKQVNIKSFKVPNLLNRFIYRFFRKSKARRSFEYACKLESLNIQTPQPMAYYEFTTRFLFFKSFYISEHLNYDLTFRELNHEPNYPNHELILRAFTRFTYNLHENMIIFEDHSPGNTLIKLNNGNFEFYLVDLNRMKFGPLDLNARTRNFAKLSKYRSMVEIMSDEYAKCIAADYEIVFNAMWKAVQRFRKNYQKRMQLKKKLKFWK